MSTTLGGFSSWLYRLRTMRMAGAAHTATKPNSQDDITRMREEHDDERRLLRNNGNATHLAAAREQRVALRKHMTIL